MQISWNGLGCFTISAQGAQGEVTLITDPYKNTTGLKLSRTLAASILLSSHKGDQASNVADIAAEESQKQFIINHAGEYEVKGVFVTGVRALKKEKVEHTIFRIYVEGINIAFLGAIDRTLADDEIEALGNVDILIVPVGGEDVLDKKAANEVIAQLEPRLVVPSHFAINGLKLKRDSEQEFCKEMACPIAEEKKLKITASKLPADDMQVVVLQK